MFDWERPLILSFLLSLIQSLSSIAGATPIVVLLFGEFASFDSMLKFHVWCLIASLAQFSRYTSKVTPMILTRGSDFVSRFLLQSEIVVRSMFAVTDDKIHGFSLNIVFVADPPTCPQSVLLQSQGSWGKARFLWCSNAFS